MSMSIGKTSNVSVFVTEKPAGEGRDPTQELFSHKDTRIRRLNIVSHFPFFVSWLCMLAT